LSAVCEQTASSADKNNYTHTTPMLLSYSPAVFIYFYAILLHVSKPNHA